MSNDKFQTAVHAHVVVRIDGRRDVAYLGFLHTTEAL